MHMHLNIFLMQCNWQSIWEITITVLVFNETLLNINISTVSRHKNTDMLENKKAQLHTCVHTNICSTYSNFNNQSDITSSVCRWAWLLRWGTGAKRWHQPDTEPLVLLHLCYLQGAEREGLLTTCLFLFYIWLTSCKTTDAKANFHMQQIARRRCINHFHSSELTRWGLLSAKCH